jgi:hypothetical protein
MPKLAFFPTDAYNMVAEMHMDFTVKSLEISTAYLTESNYLEIKENIYILLLF